MIFPELIPGRFVRRDNRFRATVTVDGRETWAHVPNSGRLGELFTPGRQVWLSSAGNPDRKTAFDLKLVQHGSVLVSVDARLPNPLVAEALPAGSLLGTQYPRVEREVRYGSSRLDFRLAGSDAICWLETKSVTLVEKGIARFPDAPTGRGRRHLLELMKAKQSGDRSAVLFIVQRPDAIRFAPHETADPAFATTLRQAAAVGVDVRAFNCAVSLKAITIADQIPLDLG
jgi:sugar fermentation stimulation protein A